MWKAILSLLTFRLSFAATPKKITAFLDGKGESERRNAEYAAPEAVRAATVQLVLRAYRDWRDYAGEIWRLTKSAVDAGAQLVVFPEYVGLAPITTVPGWRRMLRWMFGGTPPALDGPFPQPAPGRLEAVTAALHGYLYEVYMYTFSAAARLQHVYIAAGSFLFWEEGKLVNRCVVFGPDGEPVGAQEKICAIGPDRALGVESSGLIEPIETSIGPVGVVLGSDAYYFECFKILRERGARLIAVPGVGGGVLRDLLRCRANETGVYALYACYADGESARCGIFAPLDATEGRNGVVTIADGPQACALAARTNLEKLHLAVTEGEPNPLFLAEDYLRSYRYCGKLPLLG